MDLKSVADHILKDETEVKDKIENLGKPLFCKVTDLFNGRCTFFAVVFTVCGIILAFMGKLTMEYVALVTAIQGLIVGHSVAQDYHERNSNGT